MAKKKKTNTKQEYRTGGGMRSSSSNQNVMDRYFEAQYRSVTRSAQALARGASRQNVDSIRNSNRTLSKYTGHGGRRTTVR